MFALRCNQRFIDKPAKKIFFTVDSSDTPINYAFMEGPGGIVGSGRIEVFRDDCCIVEIMQKIASCLQTESCGKCLFCREGTHQMSDILADIAKNRGQSGDIDLLIELGEAMKINCLCLLGRTAAVPLLGSISQFHDDYDTHLKGKCRKSGNQPLKIVRSEYP